MNDVSYIKTCETRTLNMQKTVYLFSGNILVLQLSKGKHVKNINQLFDEFIITNGFLFFKA